MSTGKETIEGLKRELEKSATGRKLKTYAIFTLLIFFRKLCFTKTNNFLAFTIWLNSNIRLNLKSQRIHLIQTDKNCYQSFRWIKINYLNEDDITFPIDKFVAGKLKQQFL